MRKLFRRHPRKPRPDFEQLLVTQFHCIAETDTGHICLVDEECMKNNFIFIAQGGKTPLVLRKSREMENSYILCGDAHVYGVMKGEAWDNEQLESLWIL